MALVRSLVDGDLEGFRQEFESFLDRCPSFLYYFGTGRFLPAFFFSMFATAHNDGILDENERVYFRFDNHGVDPRTGENRNTGNLKVAVLTRNRDVQRVVRCYSISDRPNSYGLRFSVRERNSLVQEIIQQNQGLRAEDLSFEQYKVFMHGKGKSQGEAIATAFEVIREKDFRGGNRFAKYSASEVNLLRQLLGNNRLTVKEIEGIRFNPNQLGQLDRLVNFAQVRLDRRVYNSIEELASRSVQTVEENVRVILRDITYIYRNYKQVLENNIENRNQKFESHGFFLGLLANFTHLYAIDIDLDLSSRNSHVAFLVRRQAERENVPVVINLATEGTLSNTALALAIGHAKRLHASSFISIHTGSRNAVCVGLNFNLNRIPFRIDTIRLQQGRFPLVQRLFECVENEETRENIRDFLLQHLPTEIPRNAENDDRIFDCITGFAFGSSAFDRYPLQLEGGGEVAVAKYIFRYDNEDLRRHALTMVFHAQGFPIVILDIRKPHDIRSIKAIALPPGYNGAVNRVTYILNNQYELNVVLNRFNSPNLYLHRNRYASFDGNLIEVPNAENVHDISERVMNDDWQDRGQHQELFRAISRVLMPENMNGNTIIDVNGEYRFRSILHGTFYASDNSYKVLATYKVGQTYSLKRGREEEGERVIITQVTEQGLDLLLLRQPTESDTDTHPIGYILRFASNAEEIAQKENKAKCQITELMNKQRGYISITSGNEVVLSYAVFNRGAQRAEDLISIPQLYVHRLDRRGRDLRSGGLVGPESVIDENPPANLLSDETRQRLIDHFQNNRRQSSIPLFDLDNNRWVAIRYLEGNKELVIRKLRSGTDGTAHTSPTAQEILERINAILLRNKANEIEDVHDLLALDFATENQNFRYWLQDHDMFFTAQQYDFLDAQSNTINNRHDFAITSVGVNENDPTGRDLLSSHIADFKQKVALDQKDRLIAIINVGNRHWVTLVIVYQNGNYYAYYADSLGPVSNIDDNIKEALRERDINNFYNVSVHQQTDGYNCGIWVYENARDINQAIDNQQGNNIGYIRNLLNAGIGSDTRQPQRNEQYFKDRRGNISQLFKNDPLSSPRNGLIQDYPGIQGEIDPLLLQFLELRYPQRGGGGASQLGGERVISIDSPQSALDEFDGVNRVYDHSKGKGDVPAEEHGRGTGPNVISGGAPRISDVSRGRGRGAGLNVMLGAPGVSDVSRGRGRGIGPNVMSGGVPGVFGERGRNNEPDTKLETPRLSGFVRGYGRGGQL